MKKQVLLLLLAAHFSGFSQFDKNSERLERQQRDLFKGLHIKSRKVMRFTMSTADNTSPAPSGLTEYYDRNGNCIAIVNSKSQVTDSSFYDARGNKTRWIIYPEKTIVHYAYDAQGRLLSTIIKSFSDSVLQERLYRYDAPGGHPDLAALYSKNRNTDFVNYDANGNVTELYGLENKARIVYTYDAENRAVSRKQYDQTGMPASAEYNTYDAMDRETDVIKTEGAAADTVTHLQYEYDKLNRRTRMIDHACNGRYKRTITCDYNGEGLPVQETEVTDDPERTRVITRYTYEKY